MGGMESAGTDANPHPRQARQTRRGRPEKARPAERYPGFRRADRAYHSENPLKPWKSMLKKV